MKLKCLVTLALLTASTAFAHGSSHPSPQAGGPDPVGFIKIEDAPRVVPFDPARNWFREDGVLLVCPFNADVGSERQCTRGKSDAWIPATEYKVSGHTLVGYQIMYTGAYSSKQLHLYFRPIGVKTSIVQTDVLNFTGPITINADKVVVQRRRR
jgi:hypothetical protein